MRRHRLCRQAKGLLICDLLVTKSILVAAIVLLVIASGPEHRCVLRCAAYSVRRSTLRSWQNRHIIIGYTEEIKDEQGSLLHVHAVHGTKSTITTPMPSLVDRESLASTLWPPALAGAILCQSSAIPSDLHWLEIGCGLALAGRCGAQARQARRCVLTDNDEHVMRALQALLPASASASASQTSWHAQVHDWREPWPDIDRQAYHVVLGTDIAYYSHLLDGIVDTARHCLSPNATFICAGQANRASQWDLWQRIRTGGYHRGRDEPESPWPGQTHMLLYKLDMSEWRPLEMEFDETATLDGTVPIAVLVHGMPGSVYDVANPASILTDYDYLAKQVDREGMLMTF